MCIRDSLNTLPKGEYYISVYAENESDHLFWTNYLVNNKLGRSHSFDKDWSIDDYELTISTPSYGTSIVEDIYEEYEENSIINLGLLNNNYIKQDLTFHTPQDLDIRRFTTSTIGTETDGIGVRFDQKEGEVYLDLYRVYENNDKTLIRQSITSSSDGWLTLDQLPIGSYELNIRPQAGTINYYQLEIISPELTVPKDRYEDNNNIDSRYDFRTINGQLVINDLSIHDESDIDYYRFVTSSESNSSNSIKIDFWNEVSNLDVEVLNIEGDRILRKSDSFNNYESIDLESLPANEYLLRVKSQKGNKSKYSLNFDLPKGTVYSLSLIHI